VKITLVLLAAYAIVGTFHSYREFYRGRKYFSELHHRPRWFMCGLTWMPVHRLCFHSCHRPSVEASAYGAEKI